MDFFLKGAAALTAAQARVRVMTEDELLEFLRNLAVGLRAVQAGSEAPEEAPPDPRKAVRERSILCLESGKSYKVLTRKHLAKFGLTPTQYREKWGYPRDMPLVCKALQRERRRKMREMKLWERRGA